MTLGHTVCSTVASSPVDARQEDREMSRREFLATGAAGAAGMAAGAFADWQPSPRYPDPRILIIDPTFAKFRLATAKVERLATGFRWCEGPVWFGDGRFLLWSD